MFSQGQQGQPQQGQLPQGPGGDQGQTMAPQEGLPQSGEQISGPGIEGGINLPNMPTPPAPFKQLPTDPSKLTTS